MPTGIIIRQPSKRVSAGKRRFAKRPVKDRKPSSLELAANRALLTESVDTVRGQCALCLSPLPDVAPEAQAWWNVLTRQPIDIDKLVSTKLPGKLSDLLAPLRPVHPACRERAPSLNPVPPKPAQEPVVLRGKLRLQRGFGKISGA